MSLLSRRLLRRRMLSVVICWFFVAIFVSTLLAIMMGASYDLCGAPGACPNQTSELLLTLSALLFFFFGALILTLIHHLYCDVGNPDDGENVNNSDN